MKLKLVCAWLAAGTAMLSAAVFAHGNATGIVGERMMGMMMLGEQVKLLTPILAADAAADPAAVAKAAEMIEMHAGPAMTKLFPEGSIEGPSEARPEIWARWEEFSGYASRLAQLGTELRSAAALQPAASTIPASIEPPSLAAEWETLEFAVLLGLEQAEKQRAMEGAVVEGSKPPRSPAAIFGEITATCSSCHASFRR